MPQIVIVGAGIAGLNAALTLQEAGFPTTHTHFTETSYRLDHLSVYDWIEHYFQSKEEVSHHGFRRNCSAGMA